MIVSSFNIQNNIRVYDKNKSQDIYNYLKNNKIDILSLQEVFNKCNKDLISLLNNNYSFVGKFRYLFNFIFYKKNEKNPIISKYKILSNKTYHLPSYKSKYKRILTHALISLDDKLISIYNTHLETSDEIIQKKQLDKIYEIISKDNNIKILMGDFNLKNNSDLFNEFTKLLSNLNMNLIIFNEDTFKNNNIGEIDHIFIDNKFKLNKKKIIKDLEISDHYPIMIDISL